MKYSLSIFIHRYEIFFYFKSYFYLFLWNNILSDGIKIYLYDVNEINNLLGILGSWCNLFLIDFLAILHELMDEMKLKWK